MDRPAPTASTYPVAVIMERREKQRGPWSYTHWEAPGVVAGRETQTERRERRVIHQDGECIRYLWTNFSVQLVKDGCESYWSNLMAERPSLFIVCRQNDDNGDMEPFLVTANYDDIIGYMEVEDEVFSVPLPPDVYQWLERYVVENYVPRTPRKRRRSNWSESNDEQKPPSTRRH